MTEPWYAPTMTAAMIVGIGSGVTFLTSWVFFHLRYRKIDRRRWSWARVDALLWVAVLTGFWLNAAVRVTREGQWPYPGGLGHQIVIVALSVLGSAALGMRLVWWLNELVNARRAARSRRDLDAEAEA